MNRPLPTRLALAMSAAGLAMTLAAPVSAQDGGGIQWKFSGFGTLGLTHSSDDKSDFINDIFQPNGTGRTHSWSLNPDTRLGGQVNAVLNDQWSAVVQLVSKHQYDGTFRPLVEWANVKWQVTPAFSVRAGRIALPAYLLSESRFVGYANPWARPPIEAYSVQSITSNDGIDATFRHSFGDVQNTLQAYYGTSKPKIPTGEVKSNPAWGLNNTLEFGSWTLRASYSNIKLDTKIASFAPLVNGLGTFAAATAGTGDPNVQAVSDWASAMASKYSLKNWKLSAVSLGASYDPGNWFVMSELVLFKGDSFLSDSTSWYVSGGYRFGSLTPYVTLASTKGDIKDEPGIVPIGNAAFAPTPQTVAAFTGGINSAKKGGTPSQSSISLGLRWDFQKNMALKTQYDQVKLKDGTNGRFQVPQTVPATQADRNISLFSVVLDFVF